MKKIVISIICIILIILGILFFATDLFKSREQLSELEKSKLANESYLDILVNMEEYDKSTVKSYKLLEAAMRIARELDLVKSVSEPFYQEYVPRETIHTIIRELTGIVISSPIVDEDFYYMYDNEKDYYYIVPVGTDWIHYEKLHSANRIGNNYEIYCNAIQSDYNDNNFVVYDEMKVSLKKQENYKYVKYMLISINTSEKNKPNEKYMVNQFEDEKYYTFLADTTERTLVLSFANNNKLKSIADMLIDYYNSDAENYRNTKIVIIPNSSDIDFESIISQISPDVVMDFRGFGNYTVGDESIAEIFEEEMNITQKSSFTDEYNGTAGYMAHENGIEALIVEFNDDSMSFNDLINAIDKII